MSRALDANLKRLLQDETSKDVYDAISHELSQTYSHYIDIELLPRGYELESQNTYFLKEEYRLAIPKVCLVQAFVVARQLLMSHLNKPGRICTRDVRKATSVILLVDSEHLTAANTRKRLLLQQTRAAGEKRTELDREAYFVNSLLSSHLHRHTKSPVLWGHKHWLLRQYIEAQLPVNLTQDFDKVIYVAAERHPKNYYAWTYARDLVASRAKVDADCGAEQEEELVNTATKWCRLHHNDISGWSFLLHLALGFPRHAQNIFSQTARLVQTYSWRGESVWHFLRNLVLVPALRENQETRQAFVDLWHSVRQDVRDVQSLDAKVLDRALAWTEIPGISGDVSADSGMEMISR
ncbi:Protein prenyltransferase [Metarhizium rileyi]|uniref:Protein prenyltransferase n=1 Tax=Metarhizium rileyi (strain RCEF 4871) TaxID=1649241 RepID=A0A167EQ27_METRR|nr:Protein prenyltransferase [Metarhizium rileyi RCEF 4871]